MADVGRPKADVCDLRDSYNVLKGFDLSGSESNVSRTYEM